MNVLHLLQRLSKSLGRFNAPPPRRCVDNLQDGLQIVLGRTSCLVILHYSVDARWIDFLRSTGAVDTRPIS